MVNIVEYGEFTIMKRQVIVETWNTENMTTKDKPEKYSNYCVYDIFFSSFHLVHFEGCSKYPDRFWHDP